MQERIIRVHIITPILDELAFHRDDFLEIWFKHRPIIRVLRLFPDTLGFRNQRDERLILGFWNLRVAIECFFCFRERDRFDARQRLLLHRCQ